MNEKFNRRGFGLAAVASAFSFSTFAKAEDNTRSPEELSITAQGCNGADDLEVLGTNSPDNVTVGSYEGGCIYTSPIAVETKVGNASILVEDGQIIMQVGEAKVIITDGKDSSVAVKVEGASGTYSHLASH